MNKKLVSFIFVVFLLLAITACDKAASGGMIPIYRGMTVSDELILPASSILEGTVEEIDPVFEEDIDNAFGVVVSEEIEYYTQANSTLYITINVYNPDQFEILSFSLNGKKYQSYQFEDGSDSENLILKVETGNIEGIVEYTIDAIKYIDGTAINDVRMEGNQTVKVGIEHTILPFATVTNYVIGSSSISMDIKVTDYANLILINELPAKVFLFDGLAIVKEQDLTAEVNQIHFNFLVPGKAYQLAVGAAYDKVDGQGTTVHVLHEEVIETYDLVHMDNITTSYQSIGFDVNVIDESSVGTIQSVNLFLDDTLVATKPFANQILFEGLLAGTSYQVVLTYTYDFSDGNGIQTKQQTIEIETTAKIVPEVTLSNVEPTKDSATFNLTEVDVDDINTITLIELYKGETLIESLADLTVREFTGLLSNTTYMIKVTYTYDLANGQGNQTETKTANFSTQPKVIPSLTFGNDTTSVNQVTFDYQVIDNDEIGYLFDVSIFAGTTKVDSLTSFETLNFDNLIADTEYNIVLTYAYDANDGLGIKYIEASKSVFTAPYLGIISTEVINTERLTEGDMVYLEVEVDNPSGVIFTSVVINGDTHQVSNVTTKSYIRVEFLIDSKYTGGETAFTIEKINGYNHNQERSFDVSSNNIDYAFVNGDISVISIDIQDQNGNSLDQAMPGDVFYIRIEFDNPTGYQIDELNVSYLGVINSTQFIQNEDHTVVTIEQTSFYRNTIISYNIHSFTYSDENVPTKTKNVDGYSDFIVCVTNSNFELIHTADDLKNMKDGYAYKLANDIDLNGIQWTPRDISFIVLDGNGYTISNLRIVKTFLDSNVQLGLFRTINYSSIKNLNVDNVLIMVDLQRESTSADYQSYGGIIAGNSHMTDIRNVNVYGEISINNEVGNWNALGGIIGEANNVTLSGVYANVKLSGDVSVGGIIGRAHQVIIEKSHTSGSVYGENDLGGIFGYSYNSKITNSYSDMDIHLDQYRAGGLSGQGSTLYIKDSYYEGTIYTNQEWIEAGGLIGSGDNFTLINSFSNAKTDGGRELPAFVSYWNSVSVNNVYSLVGNDLTVAKTPSEMYDLMSDLWDLSIWGFNGEAPVLKWTPTVRIINIVQGETVLTFEVATTDFDEIGEIEKIELYQGTTLIESLSDLSVRRFEGLRYNTAYTLKVTYKYDYNDELGEQYIVSTQQIKTLAASGTPQIVFIEGGRSFDSFSFDYQVTDALEIGVFSSIEIYNEENVLVSTLLETDPLTFDGLESDHLYKVVITYLYDLSDGFGEQSISSINYVRTNPYVEIKETNVLNTDALFMGDVLVIQIVVENPDNVLFTQAVINGQTYNVTSSSLTRVRVDISIDDHFTNGEVLLTLETLTGTFMGETFVYTLEANHTDNIFINGEIYVESVEVYDLDGGLIDYLENDQTYVIEVKFFNPTEFDINSISINLSPYEWQSSTVFTDYEVDESNQMIRLTLIANRNTFQNVSITGFNYSSQELDALNKSVSGMETGVVVVSDSTPVEIWDAEDLQNIQSGFVYKLMADIDLTGFSWSPLPEFNGVFDGNGHVISNLTMVKSYTDENPNVGLFSIVRYGIIRNLNITNASLVITIKSSSMENHHGSVGVLAGYIADKSIISNVTVSGDVDVMNITNGYTNTGLMTGYLYNARVSQIMVSGSVSGKQNTGGVAGYISSSVVTNSYANIVLTTSHQETGIFTGRIDNSWVKDSYSRGTTISTINSWGIGGFSGYAYESLIENVVSFTKNQEGNYIDPIPSQWNNTFKNSYALTYSNALPQTTYSNAINQMKLVWDLSKWGFGQEFPTLKKTPNLTITQVETSEYDVSFEVVTTDYDEVGEIYSIELYQNGVLVEALSDLTLRAFDGLRYSSIYTIKVVYRYDYDDSFGETFLVETYKFKTTDKENVPSILYKNVVITEESITFEYDVTDVLTIGTLQSIELYDEFENLIETLVGNTLVFDELYTNSNYFVRINYTYDFNDGWGPNTLEAEYAFTTLAYEAPTINVSSQISTTNSIQFELDIEDDMLTGVITAVDLYLDNVLVDSLETFNQLSFDGLYSSRTYQVRVTYTYDLSDQQGPQTTVATSYISTQYVNQPWYYLQLNSTLTDGLIFSYYEDDQNDIGEIIKIELYDGLKKVDEITDFDQLMFTGLYSNKSYTILTTYAFDQNDGFGIKQHSFQTYVSTNIYSNPTVDISEIEITQNSIYYEGLLDDPNELGEVTGLSIYKNEVLLLQTTNSSISLDNLEPNVSYKLLVDYQYDLNDLKGIQTKQYHHEFETAPYANVTQTSILNIGAITIGDTLSINLSTTNPDEIYFTTAVINGKSYPVASYTVDKIRIDLDVVEELGSGLTTLVVEKLIGTYGNETYTYTLSSNNSVETFINGDIYIQSIQLVDALGNNLDMALRNTQVIAEITFYNPTQYDILSIRLYRNQMGSQTYNASTFTVNALKTKVRIPLTTSNDSYFSINVESYSYDNENIEVKTKSVSGMRDYIPLLLSNEVRYIETASDLQNMQSGYRYQLTEDIDMSGIAWTPIENFSGVLDGNGHMISNLTMIQTYTDRSIKIGLFAETRYALITDLNLVQISYVITLKTDTTNGYSAYVGGLIGQAQEGTIVRNVMVTGDISVSNKTNNDTSVGLLAGYGYQAEFDLIYTTGSVIANQYVGGIIGNANGSKLSNSYSSASYTATYHYAGGLIGHANNIILENAYASGRNYGKYDNWSIGGISGYIGYSIIKNSFSYTFDINGNIIPAFRQAYELLYENTYSVTPSSYATLSTLENILSMMESNWSGDIWSFAGELPSIKRVPIVSIVDVVSEEYGFTFDIETTDYDEVGSIQSIELYKDDVLLETLSDLSIRSFDELRYGTTYTLIVTYVYSYGDENGNTTLEISRRIKTLDKENVPIVEVNSVQPTKDSVTFDYEVTDVLGIGTTTTIHLYDANFNLVETLVGNVLIFDELLSNTTYVIQIDYTYDFDDSFGENKASGYYTFKTLAKVTPILSFKNVSSTDETISFDFTENDSDNVGQIIGIDLYLGSVLIESLTDLNLRTFVGLEAYTVYQMVATYAYNLDDGIGTRQFERSYEIKTSPFVGLTSTVLMNTEGIISGDTIVLKLTLDNPNLIVFSQVTVNGIKYDVNHTINDEIIVEIPANEGYEGGNTLIKVEALQGTLGLEEFNITMNVNNEVYAFINGDVYVSGLLATIDGQEVDYLEYYGPFNLEVSFYNPTGYDIDEVTIYIVNRGEYTFSGSELNKNSDQTVITIALTADLTSYFYSLSVRKFMYSNDNIDSKTRLASNAHTSFVLISNEAATQITTAAELQAMTSGKSYILMNDIDLTGFNWKPINNFSGYFDGGNYTISNLNITKTFEDQEAYVGLFANTQGAVIKNLNLENVNIVITTRTYVGSHYQQYIGGLIGVAHEYTRVSNVSVTGNFSGNNLTHGTIYIGGIAGVMGQYSKLSDVSVEASLTATSSSNSSMIGGITSRLEYQSIIDKAFADVTILGSNSNGGIVGDANQSIIRNVNTIVNIKGRSHNGGIAGSLSNATIEYAYSTGVIDNTEYGSGGIVGYMSSQAIVRYAYAHMSFSASSYSWARGGVVGYASGGQITQAYTSTYGTIEQQFGAIGYKDNCEIIDVYGLIVDNYSTMMNLTDIQALAEANWDHLIWDFVNTDTNGNPIFID